MIDMILRAIFVMLLCLAGYTAVSAEGAPGPIKAVYFGSNVYGVRERRESVVNLLRNYEVNAVVVDYKDDYGTITKGDDFRRVVKPFSDEGAFIICRITTFKDTVNTRGEGQRLALKTRSSKGKVVWRNYRKDAFLDPTNSDVINFIVSVSRDAVADGCQELNYDYIRFPSDGLLRDIALPVSNEPKDKYPYMRNTMRNFLKVLSQGIRGVVYPKVPYSADLFGVAAMGGEPGVGQYVEDFAEFGFGIYGMFYPSHYGCKFFGIQDPNADPFMVYFRSIGEQLRRLKKHGYTKVTLRPWLQGFSLANIYRCGPRIEYADDPARFRQQIRAILDVRTEKEFQEFGLDDSWIVWHPSAYYNPQNFLRKK